MNTVYVVCLFVCLLHVCVGVTLDAGATAFCNTPCYNNDECYSYMCSQCSIPEGSSRGTCVPGLDCGAVCGG